MNFPEISTDRLRLNEIGEDDAKALFQHFSNKEVVEFYDLEVFEQLEQAQKLIALFKQRFDDALGIRWAIRISNLIRMAILITIRDSLRHSLDCAPSRLRPVILLVFVIPAYAGIQKTGRCDIPGFRC
jgi:RimJ/RimL family protein N-acetyltransferase